MDDERCRPRPAWHADPRRRADVPCASPSTAWDPSYGASFDLEDYLEESTATVQVDLEVPPGRWQAIAVRADRPMPGAMLFVDGVRRIEAHVWIDDDSRDAGRAAQATAALCASYAAGVVCCFGRQAHLVTAEVRRGLFSVAPHANDIVTRSGPYQAHHVAAGTNGVPLMARLSQALQRRLADVEKVAAAAARSAIHDHGPAPDDDLLIIDGPLHGRQHLPRALGYIKSHRSTYLPPELNALVGTLSPGQRTPVFRIGTTWDRHSWYLRLPGSSGAPWSGVVRIECAAELPGRRGDQACGAEPGEPRQVRVRLVQGRPRPAKPLPDRRPGARAPAPARRSAAAVPGAARGLPRPARPRSRRVTAECITDEMADAQGLATVYDESGNWSEAGSHPARPARCGQGVNLPRDRGSVLYREERNRRWRDRLRHGLGPGDGRP